MYLVTTLFDTLSLLSCFLCISTQFNCKFRNEQDAELKTKLATIEDLHGRLKSNVDSVSSLNNQVLEGLYMFQANNIVLKIQRCFFFVVLCICISMFSLLVQLSELQRENVRLRSELEREVTARQTLQLQVESKDNLLSSFRSQIDPKAGTYVSQYGPGTTTSELMQRTSGTDRYGKVSWNR